MSFIQIIDVHSSKMDEIRSMDQEWQKATEGKRTLRRSIIGRDRNDENHYVVLAFFDSYDSAMTNSELPETQAFAEKLTGLVDGAPSFYDFDIIEEGADRGAPKFMEWYGAFSLMVTLVWLYLEILRLLSKLNRR